MSESFTPAAAYLQEGVVYLRLAEAPQHSIFIKADGVCCEFEPTSRPKLNLVDHDIDLRFSFGHEDKEHVSLSDYAEGLCVPGERSCLLTLKGSQPRVRVPVVVREPFHARVVGNRSALVLHAGFQRCQAILHFSIVSDDGQVYLEVDRLGDQRYEAGESLDDYQDFDIKIPRPINKEQNIYVSIDVEVVNCHVDEGESDPVVVLAAPKVVQCLGRRDRPAARNLYDASNGLPLDELDGIWLKAALPVTGLNRALRLEVTPNPELHGPIDHLLPRQKLTVLKDLGHVLHCQSVPGSQFLVRVNGEPAKRVSFIGKRDLWISIPSKFLTGTYALVDFQDLSGSLSSHQRWLKTPRILTPKRLLQEISKPPYPDHLSASHSYRFKGLQQHLKAGSSAVLDNAELATLVEILEGGPVERRAYHPFRIPTSREPDVSVIIPCHNNFHHTYSCLASLALAWNRCSYEIILVDDGSCDQTADAGSVFKGIRVVRNESPLRFLQACNRGAHEAKGKFIVLLNNDTEVTAGWLDELLDGFRRFKDVGLCGAKLLYPNGVLQEAGGIVWGSGNPWNYGRDENPHDPRFCYARQADYLSGAALMVSREAWNAVGGLSGYLEPMYFEDTDLCFKVRQAGFTTWYIPSAVVFHEEGATSGTDTSEGFKAYQERNRPKFKRKWAPVFRAFGTEGQDPDLIKDRQCAFRTLFVDYKVSTPNQDGGSVAAINEIRLLQSCGSKVTFLPANLGHLGSHVKNLNRDGVEVVTAPFCLSLESFVLDRGSEFDLFYLNRYDVARQILPIIRRSYPESRIILNLADLHYLRLLRSAVSPASDVTLEEALQVKQQEIAVMKQADLVLSYSLQEIAAIDASTDCQVKVAQCPWFVPTPNLTPTRQRRKGLSFVGNYLHHPNVEGVSWFCEEVLPLLGHSNHALLQLNLYGSQMPDSIKALGSDLVRIHGYVDDITTVYDQHLIFIAPLLSGAGIKCKVMNALASGIPCVLSPYAAEGIDLRDGHDCLIARTPDQWVDAIMRLLNDQDLWARISSNSREFTKACFSFQNAREKMVDILERVDVFVDTSSDQHAPPD